MTHRRPAKINIGLKADLLKQLYELELQGIQRGEYVDHGVTIQSIPRLDALISILKRLIEQL